MFRIHRRSFFTRAHFDFRMHACKIAMSTSEEPKELLKSAPVGMKLRMRALMPFAHHTRRVSRTAQRVSESDLRERQTVLRARWIPDWIKLMPKTLLITTGEEPRPRRTAHRITHIAVRASRAARRETVQIRRGYVTTSLEADVVIAEVVSDD